MYMYTLRRVMLTASNPSRHALSITVWSIPFLFYDIDPIRLALDDTFVPTDYLDHNTH